MPLSNKFRIARSKTDRVATRIARGAGYELHRSHFYLPFPDIQHLPAALWSQRSQLFGADLRLDAAVELLRELAGYVPDFASTGIPLHNGSYEEGDA